MVRNEDVNVIVVLLPNVLFFDFPEIQHEHLFSIEPLTEAG